MIKIQTDLPPKRRRGERRLKAVAVLPSLATLGNLVCGFGAVYMCVLSADSQGGDLPRATLNSPRIETWFPTYVTIGAYLIFLAMFFDVLDGRLARLTRKTSDFGAQLDSLADVVSFGLAPALLVLCVARPPGGVAELTAWERALWRADWIMMAVYVCCAAVRLARFNVESVKDESGHKYFKGLPSPGAAAAVISVVILHQDILRQGGDGQHWLSDWVVRLAPPLTLVVGLMMVSRVRYPHMINTFLRGRRPLSHVLAILAAILVLTVLAGIQWTLVVLSCGYALAGLGVDAWRRLTGAPPPPSASMRVPAEDAATTPSALR